MEKILIKRKEPLNRDEKRQFKKEYDWLKQWYNEIVIPLEIEFWEKLKLAGIDYYGFHVVGYEHVYKRYLDKFTSARDKTNHIRRKHQFIDIDMYYFEKLYKPLENG